MMVLLIGLFWVFSYVVYVFIWFCMGVFYGGISCGFIIGIYILFLFIFVDWDLRCLDFVVILCLGIIINILKNYEIYYFF